MSTFGGIYLTNNGKSLLAKAQTGKLLKFKRIAIGDGTLTEEEDIEDIESLKSEKISLDIQAIAVNNNTTKITFVLSSSDINESFYWRELGVIAEDPDTQEEVLYCYANAKEKSEYISVNGEADVLEEQININLITSNAENITAVIDESMVFVSETEFSQTINTINNTKSDKKKVYNITIDTTWTGTEAPYTKTIELQGILATDIANLEPIWSSTLATRQTEKEEYNKISMVTSGENSITLTCDEEKPEIALNARIEVMY